MIFLDVSFGKASRGKKKKEKRCFLPTSVGRNLEGVFPSFKMRAHRELKMSIPEFWREQILHSSDKPEYRFPDYFSSPDIQVIN